MTTSEVQLVGFVGLGAMGGPMCANLTSKSPVPVCVYDLNFAAVSKAVETGAVAATGLEDVARADLVFVCVPGEAETRSVFLGEGGLCDHASEGTTFIDCTTATVEINREVADALRRWAVNLLMRPSHAGFPMPQTGRYLSPLELRQRFSRGLLHGWVIWVLTLHTVVRSEPERS